MGNARSESVFLNLSFQVRVLTQRSKEHICRVWDAALSRIQRDAESQQSLSWNGSLAHVDNHIWFPLWVLLLDRQLEIIE
jgi:hypothetical protein